MIPKSSVWRLNQLVVVVAVLTIAGVQGGALRAANPIRLNGTLVAGGDVLSNAVQFSPNGTRVLYLADQTTDEVYEVFSVPSTGGTAVKLNGTLVAGGGVFTNGLQFSPDSSRVLYLADQTTDGVLEIYSVPSTGGTAVKLNGTLVTGGHVSSGGMQFSPDSSRVLYLADQTTDNVVEVFSVPSTGGTAVKLNGTLVAGGNVSIGGLQFSPDSSRVLYLADQTTDEVFEIFSVPSTGGTAVKLNGTLVAGGGVFDAQFSPDSSRVLYRADQTTDEVAEIYSVPSTGGTAVKLNGTLVAGGGVVSMQFSPDGSRVLYVADQNAVDTRELFVRVVRNRFAAGGGSWDAAANWDSGFVPDEVMQVFIDRSTVVTATAGNTQREVNELVLGGGGGTSVLELRSDAVISALNGFSIRPGGVLRGDGVLDAGSSPATNASGGELRADAGERLRITSSTFTNDGSVLAIGTPAALAEVEFSSPVTNVASTGLIAGSNAVMQFDGGLTNQGSIAVTTGTTYLFGDVTNLATGRIVVAGGS